MRKTLLVLLAIVLLVSTAQVVRSRQLQTLEMVRLLAPTSAVLVLLALIVLAALMCPFSAILAHTILPLKRTKSKIVFLAQLVSTAPFLESQHHPISVLADSYVMQAQSILLDGPALLAFIALKDLLLACHA